MTRTLLQLATCLAGCALLSQSGGLKADPSNTAADSARDGLARQPVIQAADLAAMRGGLRVAGLEFSVGAVVRTLIDGSLILESNIDIGDASAPPAIMHALHSGSPLMLINRGDNGFVISDAKGYTEVTHDISRDRIVATVVNQANQRRVQLELDVNITVQNLQQVQAQGARNHLLRSLEGSMIGF